MLVPEKGEGSCHDRAYTGLILMTFAKKARCFVQALSYVDDHFRFLLPWITRKHKRTYARTLYNGIDGVVILFNK